MTTGRNEKILKILLVIEKIAIAILLMIVALLLLGLLLLVIGVVVAFFAIITGKPEDADFFAAFIPIFEVLFQVLTTTSIVLSPFAIVSFVFGGYQYLKNRMQHSRRMVLLSVIHMVVVIVILVLISRMD